MMGNVPTMFIRVAVSGLPRPVPPKFELLAHDPDRPGGSPAPPLDPNIAVSLATAVVLYDDVNSTGAALAYFLPPFRDNVYLLKVVIEIPGTRLWIRITNTTETNRHDERPRSFVWVVADGDDDARQPWIHATFHGAAPADVRFNAVVGQTPAETAQPVEINNFGTGQLSVGDVTPVLTSPYAMSGLPLTLGPNASATITVGFNAITPGDTAPTVFSFVTDNNSDPGPFGRGHNNQLILSAHTSSKVWVTRAPMPTTRLGFALAAASNGKLYAIGGSTFGSGGICLPTVEEYDPTTNRWSAKAPMPTPRADMALATAGNGKIYVFGGWSYSPGSTYSYLHVVEEYDPANDSWATRAPMPDVLDSWGAAAAANGKLYFVGNGGKNRVISTVGEYDPAFNSWTTKPSMPTSRSDFGLAVAGNGKLYAVGGTSDNTKSLTAVEEFDPESGTWAGKAAMPTGRKETGLAAAHNGKLYVAGGGTEKLEAYDPATDNWATGVPMRVSWSKLRLVTATNGNLYAVADTRASIPPNAMEEYTP
jgi:N-acetylneuraminic acid mutarotase